MPMFGVNCNKHTIIKCHLTPHILTKKLHIFFTFKMNTRSNIPVFDRYMMMHCTLIVQLQVWGTVLTL